jgi:hypothetical protein
VEFVTDRMLYITLKGRWCDIIALNVHAPTEDKDDVIKDSIGRKDVFKPVTGNESVHEASNDNGVRVVNFAT